MPATTRHSWKFFRAGGLDQVVLETADDFRNIAALDPKLWVALACPVRNLEFDEATLKLIDTDGDGRVRQPEIVAAVEWACARLKDPALLRKRPQELELDAIDSSKPAGAALVAAARRILEGLGKSGARGIALADVLDAQGAYSKLRYNGDGIVTPATAAGDAATAAAIADCVACLGGLPDRSGEPGVDAAKVVAFFAELEAYAAWFSAGEKAAGTFPLGADTGAALAALAAVKTKVDDYFARCRLVAFDARAAVALNRQESEFLAIAAKDLSITPDEVRVFPLARVDAGRALPLVEGVNPAWVDAVEAFRAQVVEPLLGKTVRELKEADWLALCGRFKAYEAWSAAKAGTAVEKLGIARVRALLAADPRPALHALIAEDLKPAAEFDARHDVERLARYVRDLFHLLTNFTSFSEFYGPAHTSIFQCGTLYLDSRGCDLCVRVEDAAKHGTLAGLSRIYLAYCDCVRDGGKEKMQIAAAFTAGDSDNLMVGRNGVFFDRDGRDWDATITKVVENPISVRQAFLSPYKKLLRFVEEQASKRAAAADDAATAKLNTAALTAVDTAATGQAPATKPKIDIGTVAALGVAVGGITAALGVLLDAFFGLGYLMPLGVVGLVLAISGPSMLIAALKLRQRNLGPILDANGWAVNGLVKINIPFGGSLTDLARLPLGSRRLLVADPYAEEKKPWGRWIALAVVLAAAAFMTYRYTQVGEAPNWWKVWETPVLPAPVTPPPPAPPAAS